MGSKLIKPNQKINNVLSIVARGDNSYGNVTFLNKKMNYVKIFSENFQTFAIDINDTLFSWGLNDFYQLANGKRENYLYAKKYDDYNHPEEREFNFINTFSIISVNPSFIQKYVKLNFLYANGNFPIKAANITKISCGEGYSIFLTDKGDVYSCGRNDKGQLGYSLNNEESEIVTGIKCGSKLRKVNYFSNENLIVNNIICGRDFTFAECTNGLFYSWGNNKHFQLGRENNFSFDFTPAKATFVNEIINNGSKILKLVCGWIHGCFIDSNSGLYLWGNPFIDYDKNFKSIKIPRKIDINNNSYENNKYNIIDISSGFHHIGLIVNYAKDNTKFSIMTFGANEFGQLGYETQDAYTTVPRIVRFKDNEEIDYEAIDVICGAFHTVCRMKYNVIYAFGQNDNGQVGNYKEEFITKPVKWNYSFDEENEDTYNDTKMISNIICGNGYTVVVYKNKDGFFNRIANEEENKKKYIGVQVKE